MSQIGSLRWPTVLDRDAHQHIVGDRFGIFHRHIEEAVVGEDAGILELVLAVGVAPPRVLGDERLVGVGRMGIAVEHRHVGMRRQAVEMIVMLLDVLTVIALAVGQAEQPLLEDAIASVPQREA